MTKTGLDLAEAVWEGMKISSVLTEPRCELLLARKSLKQYATEGLEYFKKAVEEGTAVFPDKNLEQGYKEGDQIAALAGALNFFSSWTDSERKDTCRKLGWDKFKNDKRFAVSLVMRYAIANEIRLITLSAGGKRKLPDGY